MLIKGVTIVWDECCLNMRTTKKRRGQYAAETLADKVGTVTKVNERNENRHNEPKLMSYATACVLSKQPRIIIHDRVTMN